MAEQEQKHPKGAPGVWKAPNFGLIVVLFGVFILLALGTTWYMLHSDGKHIVPGAPQSVPSQN
jgi:hypothetical protein